MNSSVTSITNMIYINQNMHIQAAQQTAQFGIQDLQSFINLEDFNSKDKVIEKITPTESTIEVDERGANGGGGFFGSKRHSSRGTKAAEEDVFIGENHIFDVVI